ncbi:FliM/FliN family flagellar motor switch protein [Dyella acidisoli]|uniref:Flagellar motor switch protein FliN-like C-terminal domain-containing protein n=1 Tax=Dyella acidisoli TaxID=1867834 RepID=A0ABQ5XNL5_9GAMM|nr:FliM/FliN family flagellar motor C-terminal domain-containing protein [Dyella acidisoli]GLQ92648.1 hypothetical protein GCM10007901_15990 [Dyella acidisoli]
MKPVGKPWRPTSPSDLRRIQGTLARVVEAWLRDWIVAPDPATVRISLINGTFPPSPSSDAIRWSLGASVRLAAPWRAWDVLLRKILVMDADMPAFAGNTVDALLEPLRTELQDDLLLRLSEALMLESAVPMTASQEPDMATEVQLTCMLDDALPLFDMHFAAPWRWLAREGTQQTTSNHPPLLKRGESLADTRLKIAAVLGHCEMSAADLGGLTVGDVITTRQLLNEPLDLAMLNADGTLGQIFACGRPVHRHGKASLQITSIKDISQ